MFPNYSTITFLHRKRQILANSLMGQKHKSVKLHNVDCIKSDKYCTSLYNAHFISQKVRQGLSGSLILHTTALGKTVCSQKMAPLVDNLLAPSKKMFLPRVLLHEVST